MSHMEKMSFLHEKKKEVDQQLCVLQNQGRGHAEHAANSLNSLGHSLAEETRKRRGVSGASAEQRTVLVTKQSQFSGTGFMSYVGASI